MEQIIDIYNEFHGDIFISIIRVLIGILLILNEKYISEKLKCYITVIYLGGILGTVIPSYFGCSTKGILLGMVLGFVVGWIYAKFQKKAYVTDLIFLFTYFYVFVGLVFVALNINFSEMLGIYTYYIDYATIYAAIIIATILTVVTYIVIIFSKKKKVIKAIAENKYFWIGNYFIVSLLIGVSNFPVYGPGEGNEMSLVLLNVTDNFQFNCLIVIEVVMVFLYRAYKKMKTEK